MTSGIIKLLVVSSLSISAFAGSVTSCNNNHHVSDNESANTNISDTIKVKELANNYSKGKQIFNRFCDGCHIAPDKKATDQIMFDNLFKKLPSPSEEYFIKYIKNSKSLKDSGDHFAKELSKVFNSAYEHNFNDSLTGEGFYTLVIYMKVATKR